MHLIGIMVTSTEIGYGLQNLLSIFIFNYRRALYFWYNSLKCK